MTHLTPHFTLEELTASATAARLGIANTPDDAAQINLLRLALVLEEAREVVDCGMHVSSGYRCPAVNSAVGGAATSAHLEGRAADFTPGEGTLEAAFDALARSTVPFDQLIIEHTKSGSAWIHLGIATATAQPRRQVLAASGESAGTMTYTRIAEG